MGCCESRELQGNAMAKFVPMNPNFDGNSTSCSADEGNDDTKYQKILTFTEEAIEANFWKVTYSEPHIEVKTTQGSPFNHEMPVAYSRVDFGAVIPPEQILKVLATPELRKSWDEDLLAFVKFDEVSPNQYLVYSVIDFKIFFLQKREMIERHYTTIEDNTGRIVYFSIEHPDFPVKPDYLRQTTLFASAKVVKTETGTTMHFMLQFLNNKLKGCAVWKAAMNKLVKWCRNLRMYAQMSHRINS